MNAKSHTKYPSEIELIVMKMLRDARFAGVYKDNTPIGPEIRAGAVRLLEDNMLFKEATMEDRKSPARLPQYVIKNYKPKEVDNTETRDLKEEIVTLLVMCAILPDSKVLGRDMFTKSDRPAATTRHGEIQYPRKGMRSQFDKLVEELQKTAGKGYKSVMADIMDEYKDRLQDILDKDDDLYKNAEVDDLESRFQKVDEERLDWEFQSHQAEQASAWTTADESMLRHERMATRLALAAWATKNKEEKLFTDSEVEEMRENNTLPVSKKEILFQDRLILQKNNAAYFRRRLEEKAILLRELSFKAEQMQNKKIQSDWEFISMVTRVANRTKQWAEKRLQNPKPYSKRAVNALWNEAVSTLHALGIFRDLYLKYEYNSDIPCSFFLKKTAEDMVNVRSGENWADELRTLFYESDDGTGRTPVRGSGND